MSSSARAGEVPCPDPSVHDHQHQLSEQASTAALYVTDPAKRNEQRQNPLGPDGKLSSQSAAASLKYARPQDLPSFPSHGLNTTDSAGKAAMLAKDYKMKDLWQPEQSSAGSKAALLAHKDGGKLDLWQPSASKEGNSAAVLAMRAKGLSPELDRGYTQDGKHRALLAATRSVHRDNNSSPAPSAPAAYPDSHNAGFNALNAATRANTTKSAPDGWDSEANQAARIKNLSSHIDPSVFQENPHLDIDPDETKHQVALRASAVSMAKQMYEYQNRTVLGPDLTGRDGAAAAAAQQQSKEPTDLKQEAMRYIHLQDAAHKLAQERLAKVDKNFEAAKYREYYGYPDEQPSRRKSFNRLSMRSGGGRGRRRAASDSNAGLDDDSDDDEQQARKIRNQMSQLSSGLNNVDDKKRSDDRAKLMAAAEKSVHDRMHKMDEKVFADTGKIPPAMMEDWENKARERAQKEREMQAQNPGKTHVGGGKFIDQSEIEAIAAARLKPTLDEINDTAEKKRVRDQELREEKEEQDRQKREEKQKKAEEKDEQRRVKNEERAAKKQEKEEARARKSEEKRKSREVKREEDSAAVAAVGGDGAEDEAEGGKRKSTLGRIASRLRRKDNKPEEQEIAQKEEDEAEDGKDVTPAAALGAAGAGAGGLAAADAADKDEEDEVDPVTKREAEEQEELDKEEPPSPSAAPGVAPDAATAAAANEPEEEERLHSGDRTDATRETALPAPGRPELEKHFSHIGHSDDDEAQDEADDEDEDEWDNPEHKAANEEELAEKGKERFSGGEAAGVAALDAGAGGLAATSAVDHEHEKASEGLPTDGPHQTYAANQLDPNLKDAGAAPHTIGPHESDVANVIHPDTEKPMEKTSKGKEPVKDDNEDSHLGRDAVIAGGVGAAGVGAYEATKGDDTGPASKTIGPHESNLANIADPSVKPDPAKQDDRPAGDETGPAASTFGPHRSDIANIVDPRVKPEPEKMKAGEKHAEGKRADDPEPTEKEKGGIRGFFSKLRGKDSKEGREPGKISKSRYSDKDENQKAGAAALGAGAGAGAAGVAAADNEKSTDDSAQAGKPSADAGKPSTDNTAARTSSGATSEPRKSSDKGSKRGVNPKGLLPPFLETKLEGTSTNDRPLMKTFSNEQRSGSGAEASTASPSSFQRGVGSVGKTSDVSSSGLEEDDLARGRTNTSSVTKPGPATGGKEGGLGSKLGVEKEEDEDADQFEEARDHFDESLAPPPAFAGQAKSESPHRETRFREEV